jgi:hypothetical protein
MRITPRLFVAAVVAAAVPLAAWAGPIPWPCQAAVDGLSASGAQTAPGTAQTFFNGNYYCIPGPILNDCNFCTVFGLWFDDPKEGWVLVLGTKSQVSSVVPCNKTWYPHATKTFSGLPKGTYMLAVSVYNAPCGGRMGIDLGDINSADFEITY